MATTRKFWKNNPFDKNGAAAVMVVAFEAGLAEYVRKFAERVENYAKEHAPWEDQTGDAREGLVAKGYYRFTSYTIVLAHTVDYGVWLEIRWGGKYAIIMPTLEHMGDELMSELSLVELVRLGHGI
jgi:hypothetical protein